MSFYQFYNFRTNGRFIAEGGKQELRRVSSRADITSTRFSVEYYYGDFKGDAERFLAQWFDMHLYVAAGGTRRLMIKLPAKFSHRVIVERIIGCCEFVKLIDIGKNCILDVHTYDDDVYYEESDDSSWLDPVLSLQSELLSGDLRLVYLLCLVAADREYLDDDEQEPLSGYRAIDEES